VSRGLSIIQKRILSLVCKEKFITSTELLKLWGVQPGAVVDDSKYGAAHAALSRTLTRLWRRGLIEYWHEKLSHYRTAITLTNDGKLIAETISYKKSESG
jgi:hypothetical protein